MIFEEFEEKKTGADLVNIIQSNSYLQQAPIKYTIAYLLKKRLINPSTLIDEQVNSLEEEKDRYRCHFVEADICNFLLIEGNKEQQEFAKQRAIYNAKFNKTLQHKYSDKVENEIERREYFDSMYGFNPEED